MAGAPCHGAHWLSQPARRTLVLDLQLLFLPQRIASDHRPGLAGSVTAELFDAPRLRWRAPRTPRSMRAPVEPLAARALGRLARRLRVRVVVTEPGRGPRKVSPCRGSSGYSATAVARSSSCGAPTRRS